MTLHDCGVQEVEALFERLKDREEMAVGTSNEVRVDIDDVEFLVRSVWCCCSAFALAAGPEVTAKANKGLWRSTRAWFASLRAHPERYIIHRKPSHKFDLTYRKPS